MRGKMKNFMKKQYICAAVILLALQGAFAGGQSEDEPRSVNVKEDNKSILDYTYSISYEQGKTVVTLGLKDERISYGIGKIGDAYFDLHDGSEIPNGDAYFDFASTPTESVDLAPYNAELNLPQVLATQLQKGSSSQAFSLDPIIAIENNTASFGWYNYEADIPCELLFFTAAKKFERIVFTLRPEFFTGERQLFNDATELGKTEEENLNYKQKCIVFMGMLIQGSEFFDDYKTVAANSYNINSDSAAWDLFSNIEEQRLAEAKAAYKRAFIRHFSWKKDSTVIGDDGESELPFIDFTSKSFEHIYGATRNAYAEMYTRFAYEIGKPLLSTVAGNVLIENGSPYDWKLDYSPITSGSKNSEGDALAKAALKYLTWGVEYTPFIGFGTIDKGDSSRMAYKTMFNSITGNLLSQYEQWLNGPTPDGQREDNYLVNSNIFSVTQSSVEDGSYSVLPVDDHLRLIAMPGTDFSLSRLDVWTSENVVWKEASTPVIYGTMTDGQLVSLSGRVSALNNQQLVFDGNSTSSSNLVITRNQYASLQYGYEFDNALDKVGGLLVVRGASPIGPNIPADYPIMNTSAADMVKLYIEHTDGTVTEIGSDEMREVVLDTNSASYVQYPAYGKKRPGYGLTTNYFANKDNSHPDGTQLTFCYLIPTIPVENVKEIRVIDKTGTAYINITELMIFDSDPLSYLPYEEELSFNTSDFIRFESHADANPQWSSGVNAGLSGLFLNTLMDNSLTIEPDSRGIPFIDVTFSKREQFRQVVLWDTSGKPDDSSNITVQYGNNPIKDSPFYSPIDLSAIVTWNGLESTLESPFLGKMGNPLPYAPLGIDSPRTFNYKMHEQMKARNVVQVDEKDALPNKTTTFAVDGEDFVSYKDSYIDEMDLFDKHRLPLALDSKTFAYTQYTPNVAVKRNKPFLPGLYLNTKEGYYEGTEYSLYEPDKTAGVDSLGMLIGAASMTRLNILDRNNTNVAENLNSYFEMASKVDGLDSNNKPAYYTDDPTINTYLDGDYRLTRAEIEKTTILVPDISLIEKGDLLVKFDTDINGETEPHIGIVVGFTGTKPTAYGTDARLFWDKVLVLSVRRGFKMVTLGTWGNSEGMFKGFTTQPEEYQIRRLLKYTNANAVPHTRVADDASWDLIAEVPIKTYTDYVFNPRKSVPWTNSVITTDSSEENSELRYQTLLDKDYRFYKYLPYTSFEKTVTASIFGNDSEGEPIRMIPTNSSGWRNLGLKDEDSEETKYSLRYHRGFDVVKESGTNDLFAPEDGKLWYLYYRNAATDKEDAKIPVKITISLNDLELDIEIDSYTYKSYGMVGVLLTNPSDLTNGRIYLFAHQTYSDVHDKFLAAYEDEVDVPTQFGTARDVNKGEWIGFMGNEGIGTGAHVHMEIYEYFQDIQYTKEDLSSTGSDDQSVLNTWNTNNGFKWCRVDPRTVFDQSLFSYNQTWDYADIVENAAIDEYGLEERKRYVYFQPWILFDDFRSEK